MTALSTNYGAPVHLHTPGNTKKYHSNNSNSNSNRSHVLSSLSRNRQNKSSNSKMGEGKETEIEVPETRWDRVDHHASVIAAGGGGDGHSFASGESGQMIIKKNTEWDIAFEGGNSNISRSLSQDLEGEGTRYGKGVGSESEV